MQDGKALQAGTSHFLGQNFAKSFDVKFTDKEGQQQYVWATSWGVSTRLMGALVMAHGDDNGLVLPPALAPIQVVMVPIYKTEEEHAKILDKMDQLKKALEAEGHTVKIDDRDTLRPGFKFAEWELKGVPVRLAMGPRDLENGTVEVHRRDTLQKQTVALEGLDKSIAALLDDIQKTIYQKAFDFRASTSRNATTGRSSRPRSAQASSCSAIGTARPRPSRRSRTRQRPRSVAFLWTVLSARRKARTSTPASLRNRGWFSPSLINWEYNKLTMNVEAIKRAVLSVALALVWRSELPRRPTRRWRNAQSAAAAAAKLLAQTEETKVIPPKPELLEQLVDDEPQLCSE